MSLHDLLSPDEITVYDRLRELELPDGQFTRHGQPDILAGTITLIDTPQFRAYLITAHGKYDLMIATKGADDDRTGRTGRVSAHGLSVDSCKRVAMTYQLRLGRRQQDAQAADAA